MPEDAAQADGPHWRAVGRIQQGQIENRLVSEYGEAILAAPEHKGFGLLAWWLPIAGIVAAAAVVGVGAWRWSRARERESDGPSLDPAAERRLDDELARWDT